jgi:iron(III) transport system permease protein
MLLLVRGSLARQDPALEEAARTLGRSAWSTFARVTLPQTRPALAAGGLLVALYCLRDFGAVSIMRFDSFTRVIFTQYRAFDRSSAAAYALVLVAIALILAAAELRLAGRATDTGASRRVRRRPGVVALGRWRWPALALCCAVVTLGLLLPAGVLAYWSMRAGWLGWSSAELWADAGRSALASLLGAGATLGACLPIAWLAVRSEGRASRLVERTSLLGFALPGIVVALAFVSIGARWLGPLYQTLPLLIAAYVVLFLPQGVGAARGAFLQIHPNLEESARSLGRRPLQVVREITLPIAAPGLWAGFGLIFLTAMKELPATLLLGPIGFSTLATSLWSSVSEAYFAEAAAPALLLVMVSAVPMRWLLQRSPGDIR